MTSPRWSAARAALAASLLGLLTACAATARGDLSEDAGATPEPQDAARDAPEPDAVEDDAAEDTAPEPADAEEPDAEPAGIALQERAWRMDSLTLTTPEDPAVLLNALVRPNIADGTLNVLFHASAFTQRHAPATFRLRADAALPGEAGGYRFDPEATGVPGDAAVEADGAFTTTAPLPTFSFPVTTGSGEEARVLFLLPVKQATFTGRMQGEVLAAGTLSGVLLPEDAERTEVPLNGETFPLSNLLGFKDLDLDADGEPDAWSVGAEFTGAAVTFEE